MTGAESSVNKVSYGQILNSTTIAGGSQVINILLGIVRTKVMALLLGPAGIGLLGLYYAVTGSVGAFTGLGIGTSGVRQIAEAAGRGDEQKVARTALTLRRTSIVLGILGALLTVALSIPLSWLTFGNADHWQAITLLSITVLLTIISGGQVALLQGLRRIADLARVSVLGALFGTVCSIPMIYFWGQEGIVPLMIILSAMTILTSWWYARKVTLSKIDLSWRELSVEARALVFFGITLMASSLMFAGVIYLLRVIVASQLGLVGVGLYQAAFTLSSLYVGIILNAMGMDFYPRLTMVAQDNEACNRMVNEQTEVGLLVATPGIIATLTFAPLILGLFYSDRFIPAYDVLRWQTLGVFLRVVSWPIGYVLLAKRKGKAFFWTELVMNIAHLALLYAGVTMFGLEGTGMAFFVLYILYTVMILAVVRQFSEFWWSPANLRLGVIISTCIAIVFLLPRFVSPKAALALGTFLLVAVSAYCLWTLYSLVGPEWVAAFQKKVKDHLGWMRTG